MTLSSPWLQRHRRLVAFHGGVQLVQLEVSVAYRVVHLGQVRGRAVPPCARPFQVLQGAGVELLAEQDDAELERVFRARGLGPDALSQDFGSLLELSPDQNLLVGWCKEGGQSARERERDREREVSPEEEETRALFISGAPSFFLSLKTIRLTCRTTR